MKKLVTKDSLVALLARGREMQIKVIGRALVALFNRQVEDEKNSNLTKHHNCQGFAPADAYSGTLTAKYYLKHRTLLDWQIERWMKPTATGLPRIVKYSRQLNEVANEKQHPNETP
jgi:hypothetical protein